MSLSIRDALARLANGQETAILCSETGFSSARGEGTELVFPGSFNPLHQGHRELAQVAGKCLGLTATYELSVRNVDKSALSADEISTRLQQFPDSQVVLTNAPLFTDKAAIFPGCAFVVGMDTAERLLNPQYYGGTAGVTAAMSRFADGGHRFVVGGRVSVQDGFRTAERLDVPEQFRSLFIVLSESDFRVDLSSTQLREGGADPV